MFPGRLAHTELLATVAVRDGSRKLEKLRSLTGEMGGCEGALGTLAEQSEPK